MNLLHLEQALAALITICILALVWDMGRQYGFRRGSEAHFASLKRDGKGRFLSK